MHHNLNHLYSPGVRAVLAMRMDAAHGTPNVKEKVAVALGLGAQVGLSPELIAQVQAGEARDVSTAETELFNVLSPLLGGEISADETSLVTWAKGFFAELEHPQSIPQAAANAKTALQTEGGVLLAEVVKLGEGAWQALVGLVLVNLGKVVPAADQA